MGRYVEKHLYENELIVEKARRDNWGLIGWWTFTVLLIAAPVAAIALGYQTLGLGLCALPARVCFAGGSGNIRGLYQQAGNCSFFLGG